MEDRLIVKEFLSYAPLRWALALSLAIHVLVVGWVGSRARMTAEPDVDRLRLVSVDTAPKIPPPPSYKTPKERVTLPPPRLLKSKTKRVLKPRSLPKKARAKATRSHSALRKVAGRPAPAHRVAASTRTPTPSKPAHQRVASLRGVRPPTGVPSTRGSAPPPVAPKSSSDEDENVPEGPTDLQPAGEEDAAETTPLTKGSNIVTNTKVKGETNTAFARIKPFSGPGVIYTLSLNVPPSAPPGTVYTLDLKDVVLADKDAKSVPFTLVPGTLTVVPTKAVLPPAEQPSLAGNRVGVGKLYAHRGTRITVEVYVGDAFKDLMGVQARLVFRNPKLPPKKIKPQPANPAGPQPEQPGVNGSPVEPPSKEPAHSTSEPPDSDAPSEHPGAANGLEPPPS